MFIHLIAAVDKQNGIGLNNKIPWSFKDYKEDIQHFQAITNGHAVLMGKKTFESIGKPLKNRANYVITSSKQFIDNVSIYGNIEHAISAAKIDGHEHLFIIGGAKIYDYVYKNIKIDYYHITHIDKDYFCDTFLTVNINTLTPIYCKKIRNFQIVQYISKQI